MRLREDCEHSDICGGVGSAWVEYIEPGSPSSRPVHRMLRFEIIRERSDFMTRRRHMVRLVSLSAAVILAVIAVAQPPRGWAQSVPSAKPEFELVSVRPIKPPEGKSSNPCNLNSTPSNLSKLSVGNRFTLRNETLGGLIRDAYNVRDDQYTGLPGWADCRDQYEIKAKAAGDGTPTPDQVRLMLQAMLADRFHLKLHHETKNLAVYELTIAKSGFKEKLFPERTEEYRNAWGLIPTLIETYLDYPLVDKTGLTGFFDTRSVPKWDAAKLQEEMQQARPPNLPPGVAFRGLAPSISHEVERGYGLTLKKVSAPSDFIVVDHVERPSAN
jgi:hypothetical protein